MRDTLRLLDAETLQAWVFRAAEWAALHVLDDPAWLALMFC